MKNIYLFIFLCLFFSCNGQTANSKSKDSIKVTSQNESIAENSCDEKLKSLIATCSNLDNPFKERLLVEIENVQNDIYTIRLYVKDTGVNSENTVGTILLNLENRSLVDITYDMQNGTNLKYDKELFDSYVSDCLGKNLTQNGQITNFDLNDVQICNLPFDFNDFFNMCYPDEDNEKCKERYPMYSFDKDNSLTMLLKQNKYDLPNEYIFLPNVNKIIHPVILCYTESDVNRYVIITIIEKRIISHLEIGRMDGKETIWFNIDKKSTIDLYRGDEKNPWKTFKMADNGMFSLQ